MQGSLDRACQKNSGGRGEAISRSDRGEGDNAQCMRTYTVLRHPSETKKQRKRRLRRRLIALPGIPSRRYYRGLLLLQLPLVYFCLYLKWYIFAHAVRSVILVASFAFDGEKTQYCNSFIPLGRKHKTWTGPETPGKLNEGRSLMFSFCDNLICMGLYRTDVWPSPSPSFPSFAL